MVVILVMVPIKEHNMAGRIPIRSRQNANTSIDTTKTFEICRELIRHEDGLVNNRITWFLVLQGFLLNAFVSGLGLYEKLSEVNPTFITFALAAIAFLGICACLVASVVTHQAYAQVSHVAGWWKAKIAEKPEEFPAIRGAESQKWWERCFGTHSIPWFVAMTWLALLSLLYFVMAAESSCRISA